MFSPVRKVPATQTMSSTDRSFVEVVFFDGPDSVPSPLHGATIKSHLSASFPGRFCARHANFLPSGENRGELSAAGLSFVSVSHSFDLLSIDTRQRSWFVLHASPFAGTAVKTRNLPSGENTKSSPTLNVVLVG